MNRNSALMLITLVLITILVVGCGTQSSQEGPVGPQGAPGPPGPAGPPGRDASVERLYVGAQTCQGCHTGIYDTFILSGHPYKLSPVVNGTPPEYPFTEIPEPPEGYSWEDISYVIGGYNWKARFIDQEGYIITGDENATTQYNFRNNAISMGPEWVAYHAGESEKVYNCGTCHTTGYRPEGNQDERPGLIGTWAEPGIQCEECHGPGSLHITNPYSFGMEIDRSAESCGACHIRGDVTQVDASGGLIRHHEQYEELFQSKHLALECVDCHDPHAGVIQLREAKIQTTRTTCEQCHFQQANFQSNAKHVSFKVDCIDCHMPRLSKSALGDPEQFTGDLRTHVMAIDPFQIGQFTEDGSLALSQISLDFACKSCHTPGSSSERSDEELLEAAVDYHARPEKLLP